jgi:hypothetical protein
VPWLTWPTCVRAVLDRRAAFCYGSGPLPVRKCQKRHVEQTSCVRGVERTVRASSTKPRACSISTATPAAASGMSQPSVALRRRACRNAQACNRRLATPRRSPPIDAARSVGIAAPASCSKQERQSISAARRVAASGMNRIGAHVLGRAQRRGTNRPSKRTHPASSRSSFCQRPDRWYGSC